MQYEYKSNNKSVLIYCVPYFQLHENRYNDMVLACALWTLCNVQQWIHHLILQKKRRPFPGINQYFLEKHQIVSFTMRIREKIKIRWLESTDLYAKDET